MKCKARTAPLAIFAAFVLVQTAKSDNETHEPILPELSSSTRPWPVRPVSVPPTVYFASKLQPMIANPAAATIVHARVFT